MSTAPAATAAVHKPPQTLSRLTRGVATLIAALAIAGPVAEASAATPHAAPLASVAANRAARPVPRFIERSDGGAGVAVGPTITGTVFNGNTTIITSPSPVVGTAVGSP
jgi:hypothetical protein